MTEMTERWQEGGKEGQREKNNMSSPNNNSNTSGSQEPPSLSSSPPTASSSPEWTGTFVEILWHVVRFLRSVEDILSLALSSEQCNKRVFLSLFSGESARERTAWTIRCAQGCEERLSPEASALALCCLEKKSASRTPALDARERHNPLLWLPRFPRLRFLSLGGLSMTPRLCLFLTSACPALECLDLSGCTSAVTGPTVQILCQRMRNLTDLRLPLRCSSAAASKKEGEQKEQEEKKETTAGEEDKKRKQSGGKTGGSQQNGKGSAVQVQIFRRPPASGSFSRFPHPPPSTDRERAASSSLEGPESHQRHQPQHPSFPALHRPESGSRQGAWGVSQGSPHSALAPTAGSSSASHRVDLSSSSSPFSLSSASASASSAWTPTMSVRHTSPTGPRHADNALADPGVTSHPEDLAGRRSSLREAEGGGGMRLEETGDGSSSSNSNSRCMGGNDRPVPPRPPNGSILRYLEYWTKVTRIEVS